MTHIESLREVIRKLDGVDSKRVESVAVQEVFQGQVVWKGIVEVFDLEGHPNAPRVYSWMYKTDNPIRPERHVTVLHVEPVTSLQLAVRAAIIQEYRANAATEES